MPNWRPSQVATADLLREPVTFVTIFPKVAVQNENPASSVPTTRHETVVRADDTN
jgi:hypothetical protein